MGISKPKDEYVERLKAEKKQRKKERPKARRPVKEIVRLLGTDLDGSKPLLHALRGVKGIGHTMAKVVCELSGLDPKTKLGSLSERQIKKLEDIIKNPVKYGAPAWVVNRRRDLLTGRDKHLVATELVIQQRMDVKRYMDLRTYRGLRHMYGLPVRGQRTRSSFRKGRTVGVIKKEVRIRMEKAKKG
jgi:small subunit ribosomal protein S13